MCAAEVDRCGHYYVRVTQARRGGPLFYLRTVGFTSDAFNYSMAGGIVPEYSDVLCRSALLLIRELPPTSMTV